MTQITANAHASALMDRIRGRAARIGVVGLGYVGLPLAVAAARAGFATLGFDIDAKKPEAIAAGRSYISSVSDDALGEVSDRLSATTDLERLGDCDVVAVCVPTPLTPQRTPDLRFVVATAQAIAQRHGQGAAPAQLIVLESTTYPGTTDEVMAPIFAGAGTPPGQSAFLAYSPEREDPGRTSHTTATIPKIVAGLDPNAAALAEAFYSAVVSEVVSVSSARTAEAVKLTENIFRAVNIALVNELKVTFDAMGIDVWEVLDAAATKPFGFMPFYPGPGLGGHCIPIDPFYLTWKAREYDQATRFVELAGEINTHMPHFVVAKLERALGEHCAKPLAGARVLVVGAAYKKNVSDVRESPALRLIAMLRARRAQVSYHDPHVAQLPSTRDYGALAGMASTSLDAALAEGIDAILIATDHDAVDYAALVAAGRLIVDTRNAVRARGLASVGPLVLA